MANRPRNIDLGPIYLQVGEDVGSQGPQPSPEDASASDVSHFEALLRKGREQQQRRESEAMIEEGLDPQDGAQALLAAQTGDVGDEIAQLWVGTGQRSAREVRVGLRDALLPGTHVRLCESEGVLRIEFTCETAQSAYWLDRKLSVLAKELAERLRREVELVLSMSDGSLVGTCRWCEDSR